MTPAPPAAAAARAGASRRRAARRIAPESLQLFGTYIVCPTPEGLVLVDQHAAHERILYERFLARLGTRASQHLLEPVLFDAAPGGGSRARERCGRPSTPSAW